MPDFKFGDVTEKIIGASLRVHNTLGCGFQEVIYPGTIELEVEDLHLAQAINYCFTNKNIIQPYSIIPHFPIIL